MTDEKITLNPEIELINEQIERLIKKGAKRALSKDDLDKLKSLIQMRTILQDKPSIVYVKDYDDVYDRTILSTIKKKKPTNTKKKASKQNTSKTK